MESYTRKRTRPEDWEDIEPSKVVHIRELCEHTLEIDIARSLERFGTIRDIAMIPKKRQALVEFEDLNSAQEVVRSFRNDMFFVANKPAKVNFSTSEHVVKRTGIHEESVSSANHVLIFFIYEAVYPITVEVITKICKQHGRVVRIFINRKAQILQALVEFYTLEDAVRVKRNLNGADIYSGCCTLKIEYATTNRVNVSTNTEDSWDFENINGSSVKQSLLGIPSGPRGVPQRMGMNLHDMPMERSGPPDFNDGYNMNMSLYDDRHSNRRGPLMQERSFNYSGYDDGMYHNNDMREGPCVAMVYGLNTQKVNCDKVFNLLCIYGNVLKVKFLKSKDGSAMVQMSDELSLNRMMSLLHNKGFFEQTIQFQISKQPTIMDVPSPFGLPDGTPSFKNFSSCRENRFMNPEMAAKNRVFPPSMTVNYWNAPPHLNFDLIKEEFTKVGAVLPTEFFQLTDREKSSSGLLQWSTMEEATNAIALCNHILINAEGSKYPYQLKLSFSESPIRQGIPGVPGSSGPKNENGSNFGRRTGQRGARGARQSFPRRGRF